MASTARIDELKKKFDENPRRYFAPLANEFRKAGDIDQAVLICEEFLPQQPGHMSGHIVYGQALYEAGKLPESRAVFETALGLDPENLIALRHLGDIARAQADLPTARSWYVRVLEADPRNDEIQTLIASLDSTTSQQVPVAEAPAVPAYEAPAPTPEPTGADRFAPPPEPPAPEPEPIAAATPPLFDLSLDDTQPLGMPSVPAPAQPAPAPVAADTDLLDGFSLHGFDSGAPADEATSGHIAAEGLESTSFTPPDELIPEFHDLDASLESGVPSFAAPEAPVTALAGLQGSGGMDIVESDAVPQQLLDEQFTPGFPAMELDDELVLPPQGDPLAEDVHRAEVPMAEPETAEAPVAEPESIEPPLLDLEMPLDVTPTTTMELDDQFVADSAGEVVGIEALAPESDVAVEELAVSEPAPAQEPEAPAPETFDTPDTVSEEPPVAHPPFVTETMAELYLAQGFREEALSVYTQLSSANPADERLRGLVDTLSAPAAEPAGPTIREFFAKIAARRPGTAAAAEAPPAFDDFASEPAPVAASEPAPVVEEVAPQPVTEAPSVAATDGSIDALFGNRPPGVAEDSAAAALAQAFGTSAQEMPSMTGRPAHTAAEELSLDSVFRDSPARQPRTSQSFSFDQFFSGGAANAAPRQSGAAKRTSSELPMPGDPPAERSADDIEQFNNWLQGLKQK
jgi:hypothetical protein